VTVRSGDGEGAKRRQHHHRSHHIVIESIVLAWLAVCFTRIVGVRYDHMEAEVSGDRLVIQL
jgi:hypothetical protein